MAHDNASGYNIAASNVVTTRATANTYIGVIDTAINAAGTQRERIWGSYEQTRPHDG